MRALPLRHKTLHNAIGWSFDLLSEEEQSIFARLGVFSGGFTLEAADALFSRTVINKSVSELVTLLLDKSLLQRSLDERGTPRFNMLVTIQQFALERLKAMAREAEARDWHLAYFLNLAEEADKQMRRADQVEWINRVEKELDNLRAA